MGRDMRDLRHELLLRLAGRLPDRQLWRFRDWLAGDADAVLARMLPRALAHGRLGLTDHEHELLTEGFLPAGADPVLVAAIPALPEEPEPVHVFGVSPAAVSDVPVEVPHGADSTPVVLGAMLRGRAGIREVRFTWRAPATGGRPGRVLLVSAESERISLTAELQRVLRALGEREPRVEVVPPSMTLTAYHRAAWVGSEPVVTGLHHGQLAHV
ncbi:hypothetical protein [Actinoalloteichus spitiensis]|uniref:hypothetical protein n=1 Tax=Actinoalloteichus spitiensis TaxID=252394 RepID=UPI00036F914B|nr:hypothetical protein [Actinoalloteichus spitiensis]